MDAEAQNADTNATDAAATAGAARPPSPRRKKRRKGGRRPTSSPRSVTPLEPDDRARLAAELAAEEAEDAPHDVYGVSPGADADDVDDAPHVAPTPPVPDLTTEDVERYVGNAARTVLYVGELMKAKRGERVSLRAAEDEADTFAHDVAPELVRWSILHRPLRVVGIVGQFGAASLRVLVSRAERASKVVDGALVRTEEKP